MKKFNIWSGLTGLVGLILAGVAMATPQTSDVDLKSAQNPVTGITLYSTNGGLNLTYKDCVFEGQGYGPAAKVISTMAYQIQSTFDQGGASYTLSATGTGLTLVDVRSDSGVAGGGNGLTLSFSGSSTNYAIEQTEDSVEIDANQTSPLSLSLSSATSSSQGITFNANSTTFTLSSSSFSGPSAVVIISANDATAVDVSAFVGANLTGGGCTFNFGLCSSPNIAGALSEQGCGEAWNGPFTSSFVDSLIIAWDSGGTNNSGLSIGGSSASPTAGSADELADLIANGCTVSTN